jgi:DNA-binding NtrC family response regulator
LVEFVSTITIQLPRLRERFEDLSILAQCFLEACNRGDKQVGSLRADALDRLALYSWPGELDELRDVIAAAHEACESHEITPSDLPAVIHHASQAAARSRSSPERIVLDELLARIEREAIERALAQADGNKTEAAELLGMTRPRLYRRLVQLGLVSEVKDADAETPEFIEQLRGDESP